MGVTAIFIFIERAVNFISLIIYFMILRFRNIAKWVMAPDCLTFELKQTSNCLINEFRVIKKAD